ncbi:MAG: glucosyl transferase [Ignavibacterium sp.]|nr:glucosyl transferase [Ignavibacterium sp.]
MSGEAEQKTVSLIFLLIFFLFLLCTASCNTTEPPTPPDEPTPELTLELEDVSCTETWINLTTKDLTLPAELTLKQYNPSGDSISKALLLNTQDTLLYIDSLLPNQTYKYQVSHKVAGSTQQPASHKVAGSIKSNELSVTTLDTTSHNFTFQSWTFGTIGSSVLYDVAIIDENNIIAVGEIMVADSSPNGYTTYNAVHWDGNDWELKRIPFYYQGDSLYGQIYAVYAFSPDDIWFGIGSMIHWNGSQYRPISTQGIFQSLVRKIWGSSSNDLYIVGNNGSIAHYNGTSWKKIESGTDLNINDIWGDYNEKTGEWEILAVASNFGTSLEKEILQIKNNSVIKLPLSPQMWPLKTVWFVPNKQYYVAGAGIYQKKLLSDSRWRNEALDITTYSTTEIRGNDINDVIAVGAFGDFVHFNGVNWKNNYEEPLLGYGTYGSIEIKNNLLIAVGDNYDQAVILMGVR